MAREWAMETVENSAKTTAPSFPQFPQPLLLSLLGEENRTNAPRLVQNCMDKKESEA